MATNTLLDISKITNEALMVLENELTFTMGCNRQYEDQFGVGGAKIGYTVNVRKPARYIGTSGPNLNVEGTNETYIPVTVGNPAVNGGTYNAYGDQFHVDVQFSTADRLMALDDFSQRIVKPAGAAIANRIDLVGLQCASNNTYQIIGTPGTPSTALGTYFSANAILTGQAVPFDERNVYLDPFSDAAMADSLKGLFNPSATIAEQYRKGMRGSDATGMGWYVDNNVNSQLFGAWTTSASTLTANTTSTETGIITSGWQQNSNITITPGSSITLNQGDTFTIAGVYPVNPQNRKRIGSNLQTFIVNSTVTLASAGTVNVSPALISGGQFQNIQINSASTTAGVVPTSIGTSATGVVSPQGILCHKNAFTLAMCDLEVPAGINFGGRASSKEAGLSIRIVEQYTVNNDALPCRFDTLWGWAPLYQEFSCRIAN